MGCNCKNGEVIKKLEMEYGKYATNPKPQKVEKEEITLFYLLKKGGSAIGKFLLVLLAMVVIIPLLLCVIIYNIFNKKTPKAIKLPIYWFDRYKDYAKTVKFNVTK